jgi:acyl carrier protein
METLQILKQFIKDDLAPEHDLGDLDAYKPLLESGIIGSLGILRLVVFIEKQFHVRLEDEDLIPENFETLLAISEIISTKSGTSS